MNYRSCTLGWLAGIQQKCQADKKFFAKVCEEAHEIALSIGKGKLFDGSLKVDQYSDCEIVDRAGIQSDESDEEVADAKNREHGLLPDREGGESSSGGRNERFQILSPANNYPESEMDLDIVADDMSQVSDLSELGESDEENHGGN